MGLNTIKKLQVWVTKFYVNISTDQQTVLEAAGFKYCGKKKAWSWHAGERYYKKSKRALSMDELRNLYGSEEIEKGHADRIA